MVVSSGPNQVSEVFDRVNGRCIFNAKALIQWNLRYVNGIAHIRIGAEILPLHLQWELEEAINRREHLCALVHRYLIVHHLEAPMRFAGLSNHLAQMVPPLGPSLQSFWFLGEIKDRDLNKKLGIHIDLASFFFFFSFPFSAGWHWQIGNMACISFDPIVLRGLCSMKT